MPDNALAATNRKPDMMQSNSRLALIFLFIVPLGAALPAAVGQQIAADEPDQAGVVWTGTCGVTESVQQIMVRDADLDTQAGGEHGSSGGSRRIQFGANDEPSMRTAIPQVAPSLGNVAQWPVADLPDDQRSFPFVARGGFLAAQFPDTNGWYPPDPGAAVGPTQILIATNGRIKVFTRDGEIGPINTPLDNFFFSIRANNPTMFPQVRFDRLTDRWFITCINSGLPNRVLIAVSNGPTIMPESTFTFLFFTHDEVGSTPNPDTGGYFEFPSLGIDNNALYIGGHVVINGLLSNGTAFVVRKSSVINGGPLVVTAFRQLWGNPASNGPYAPRGVDNDDPNATQGYFIGSHTQLLSRLIIRRVSSPGGTPTLGANMVITVPATQFPIAIPALLSDAPLDALDDRLVSAAVHKNRLTGIRSLWTAHNFQVNSSGNASSSGGRNGSRWYQITNLTSTPPTLAQAGTMFDSGTSQPRSYWIPAAAMSGQGHMAIGASFAGANDLAGCAAAGRLSDDPSGSTRAPAVIEFGGGAYNIQTGVPRQRWGDYSVMLIDPLDDMTFWTFQEYCNALNSWGIQATRLQAPPPATPASCVPAVVGQGGANVVVLLTGTTLNGSGFFDPEDLGGASTPVTHISASVSGSGITVNSVAFLNPTTLQLNLGIAADAPLGERSITITNPDGQMVTSAGGLISVVACQDMSLLPPPPLPLAQVGQFFSQMFTATNGMPPHTFTLASGALPSGLTLSGGGLLSGTPTVSGLFNFTIRATDAPGCRGTQAYSLRVCPVISLSPATLANGTIGVAYSRMITASGGAVPYMFALSAGTLPGGLALSSNGLLSGTPTQTGGFLFSVAATDANGCAAGREYTLAIAACPLPGDMNASGQVDAADIGPFVTCVIEGAAPPTNCYCGDIDHSDTTNSADVGGFVNALLGV